MSGKIEIDGKDLFIGMSVIISNMKKNIDDGKVTYADMEAVMTMIMPEIADMILEGESAEDIDSSTQKFAGLVAEIAHDLGIEIK
jgi:hypothetical protein